MGKPAQSPHSVSWYLIFKQSAGPVYKNLLIWPFEITTKICFAHNLWLCSSIVYDILEAQAENPIKA